MSFFPLSFKNFIRTSRNISRAIKSRVRLFNLRMILRNAFLVSRLRRKVSFRRMNVNGLIVNRHNVITYFSYFIRRLLIGMTANRSGPMEDQVQVLIGRLVRRRNNFFGRSLNVMAVTNSNGMNFFFNVFFRSTHRPYRYFFQRSRISMRVKCVGSVNRIILVICTIRCHFHFFFFTFTRR